MTPLTETRMESSWPPRSLGMIAFVSDLKLVEHRLPTAVSRYEWQPNVRDDGFTYHWWHRMWDLGGRYTL